MGTTKVKAAQLASSKQKNQGKRGNVSKKERYSMDGNIASLTQRSSATPGSQYSTYPYQVPDGQGALTSYYAANPQLAPQGWLANVLAQGFQPICSAISGAFGIPQLGVVL